MEEVRCKMDDEKDTLDKAFFVDCMKSVVRKMQRQEEMIQLLVDDLKIRNHEGVLYLRWGTYVQHSGTDRRIKGVPSHHSPLPKRRGTALHHPAQCRLLQRE